MKIYINCEEDNLTKEQIIRAISLGIDIDGDVVPEETYKFILEGKK